MSQHMQITVTIRPFYKKSFEKTYPRLAEADKLLYTLEDIFDDMEYHLD